MPEFDKKNIAEYNSTRSLLADKSLICHAPFTNINFEQTGKATACCYNRKHIMGTYPSSSVRDMWYGEQAQILRQYIRDNNLNGGCRMCKLQLESKNYGGFKAKLYDEYASGIESKAKTLLKNLTGKKNYPPMPKVMEFELENTCNLECIMCNGEFSSSIRKNREKLPPLVSPYDKKFVDQLCEFMPYLTDMKFLGGEPFMIDIYYDIWENVAKINPTIKIHITTNATILNTRTKRLLEDMRAGINISIDSVKRETYQAIRIGADYDKVMENINWLIDYTKRKGTYAGLTVCPMRINSYEMIDIFHFAHQQNLGIFFNTVWWPEEQSLRFMSREELDELIMFYEKNLPEQTNNTSKNNFAHLLGFINQLKFWRTEKYIPGTAEIIPKKLYEYLKTIDVSLAIGISDLPNEILKAGLISINPTAQNFYTPDSEAQLIDSVSYLKKISKNHPPDEFLRAYFDCLDWIASNYLSTDEHQLFQNKITIILKTADKLKEKDLMISDIIRSGLPYQVNYIAINSIEEIENMTRQHYN